MNPFVYARAENKEEALKIKSEHVNSKFIGGGTNLVDLLKLHIETPDNIIDINALPFNKIEELPNGNLLIGALVRNSDLAWHPLASKRFPVGCD